MNLTNEKEVTTTRAKLARLEARYETLRTDTKGNQRVREVSMLSLKRLINQFKEEIARYEAHQREPASALRRNGPKRSPASAKWKTRGVSFESWRTFTKQAKTRLVTRNCDQRN